MTTLRAAVQSVKSAYTLNNVNWVTAGFMVVFHVLAVANLTYTLENNPVIDAETVLDQIDVVQFVQDDDLTLLSHATL